MPVCGLPLTDFPFPLLFESVFETLPAAGVGVGGSGMGGGEPYILATSQSESSMTISISSEPADTGLPTIAPVMFGVILMISVPAAFGSAASASPL